MFNLGFSEILVISILALIFIGPKQLPEVARTVARVLNDLKRSLTDVSGEFFSQKKQVDTWARDFTTELMNAANKAQELENAQKSGGHEIDLAGAHPSSSGHPPIEPPVASTDTTKKDDNKE